MIRHLTHLKGLVITAIRNGLRRCRHIPGIRAPITVCVVLFTVFPWPGVPNALGADDLKLVIWKPDHPEVWNRAIAVFEEQTGVKIHMEIGPNSSTAAHALITQKLKNADPDLDIFMMDVIWPSEFVSARWIQPLDQFFSVEDRADFFQAAISACTVGGKIYGVPFETSGGLLYYRKDLLDKYGFKPPDTWEQLVEQARNITARERRRNPALKGYCGQFKQYRRARVQHAGVHIEQPGHAVR